MSLQHCPQNKVAVRSGRWLPWTVAVLAAVAALWSTLAPLLPAPQVSSATRPDAHQCAQCHQDQHTRFQNAPHARTLRPMRDCDAILQTMRRQADGEVSSGSVVWRLVDGKLFASLVNQKRSIPLEWAFGSGRHAITPVAVLQNPQGQTELLEHSVSWYASNELGATLGLDKS